MSHGIELTGMVLSAAPSGDYDRRVTLLTRERGKITAFARGARRQGNHLQASASPFCFGRFTLYEGKNAYTLVSADVKNYFAAAREDFEAAYYGFFFMEYAAYYGQENLDASEMINLLYASLLALEKKQMPRELIRVVFETKMIVLNGEYPQDTAQDPGLQEATRYTLQYVIASPIKRLYSFLVKDDILGELVHITDKIRKKYVDHSFKSLEILETMMK